MKTTMQENRNRTSGSAGKKLFIVLFSLGLAFGASAQRGGLSHGGYAGGGFHGGYYGHAYYPRTYVGVGFGYGWGLGYGLGLGWGLGYGYYPGWYGPWYAPYYPPYYYGRGPMPAQLNEQIDGIKSDYKAQIKDVKHDKTLPKSERNERVNQLEQQRDAAITQARHDFYNRSRQNYNGQPQRYNGNGQPNGNGQQPNNGQQQNNNNLQPGPGTGSSPNDPEHPEYSPKSTTSGDQQ